MGRLRNGVTLTQAQAQLAGPFHGFVRKHGDQRERAGGPSFALASGRRIGRGFPAPPIFEAAVDSHGHGRVDPGGRVFQHRQPAAGPGREQASRDRTSAESGRGPFPHRPSIADRERRSGASERHCRHRRGGALHSIPVAPAEQWKRQLYGERGPGLACALIHAAHRVRQWYFLRTGARPAGHPRRPHARAEGNPRQRVTRKSASLWRAIRIEPSPGSRRRSAFLSCW